MISPLLPVNGYEYGKTLVCLIKDLRKEFKAPQIRVVVGVMGVNGPRNESNPKQKDSIRPANRIFKLAGGVVMIPA